MMRWWPFRRQVSSEAKNPGPPPMAEAAPADMSRLLRIESDETRALDGARSRLRLVGMALGLGFALLGVRAIDVALSGGSTAAAEMVTASREEVRGDLLDRNGTVLATTLETHSLYADPTLVWDARETAEALAGVLTDFDVERVTEQLSSRRRFVWIRRNLTPRQRQAVFALGLPGLEFRTEPRRVYPSGRLASHVVGYSDRDLNGIAGSERAFNSALVSDNGRPVALSIDMGVQFHLDEVLRNTMSEFQALAASAIVMDVHTGEVVGMVSLPDYDPNRPGDASASERLNRSAQSVFEMGSTFKAFTVALALESGTATLESGYDATEPLEIGGYTIHDDHAENRWLTLSEIFTHSSNIGASRIALEAGAEAQRDLLMRLRLLERAPIELAESASPLLPRNWGPTETATISYGHGVAVSPIATIAAFSAIANGGIYVAPTLLPVAANETIVGERIFSEDVSADVMSLMRLNVVEGTGSRAEAIGYLVAGKTGTAEKPTRGGYDSDALISSFSAVFPYDDPQYAVLVLLDEPQGNASTYQYASGGWTAAPAVGEIVSRIAPILGVERNDDHPDESDALIRAALLPYETPEPRH
ncbi:MAG: penicillin-binding protein 2 [Maricaulis sp.]|jgi:cell division protein FtsI (penicillin-binding protein 3)|nr:penicillin-binding protein 2 [Maricaulis sp.]